MPAGVSTVQQTLTTEAANVLKLSVAEAQRRGHAQVTPLHVATTLLTGSSSVLRQACIQSHLHVSQPPQCRGLELCFNVALDRLQTTSTSSSSNGHSTGIQQQQQQPALSNALVAALKRAQAHQRRGYPEQQQVPLLAVKVEMEQLIISILDDPSVSRVMREAGFTSTQVKSSLEEALGAAAAAAASAGSSSQQPRILPPGAAGSVDRLRLKLGSFEQLGLKLGGVGSLLDSCEQYGHHHTSAPSSSSPCLPFLQSRHHPNMPGLLLHERSNGFRSNANNQHHPKQQQQPGNVLLAMRMGSSSRSSGHEIEAGRRSQDAARVMDILLKPRKRNPLLIGEQPPHGVIEEVIQRLDKGECEASLRNARLLSPQFASIALGLHGKEEVEHKLGELGRAVDECVRSAGGAVVYLGDLQWLVERPPPPPTPLPPPSAAASSAYCPVQHAVSEIGRMLNGNRVWLMGVASSQTYMRCQARHPSLEMLWGLQPLPISTGFSLSLRGSSSSSNRFASLDGKANGTPPTPNAVESSPMRAAPVRWPLLPFNFSSSSAEDDLENCCPDCTAKYEQELVLFHEQEKDISGQDERSSNGLPFWLKPNKDSHQVNGRVQKVKELQRTWSQTCQNLHGPLRSASYASSVAASNGKVSTSTIGSLPMSIPWLSLQSAGTKGIATPPQVPEKSGLTVNGHGKDVGSVCTSSIDDVLSTQIGLSLKPPVRTTHEQQQQQQQESEVTVQTDLVLGRSKSSSNGSVTNGKLNNLFDVKAHRERVEGLAGCTPSSFGFPRLGPCPLPVSEKRYPAFIHEKLERTERQVPAGAGNNQSGKLKELDFKGLCRALAETVPWQREAIDSIASTVLHCRSGVERRRGANLKCDAWLLFLGSDMMAKRKVARILAEQVFGCEKMFFRMSLRSQAERQSRGQEQDSEAAGRGRTPLDRLAEAVRAKPFSVVLLEDIEEADCRLKNALMKAMESGRLADSSGREVSVANLIVVMTSSLGENFLPKESSFKALDLSEKRLASAERVGMKLLLDDPANTGAVLHKSERVSIVNNRRILLPAEDTSEELQNGLHSKRKAGSTDLLDTTPEKRNKVEARGMEFDLNMPVEEDQVVAKVHPEEVVTSKDGSPVKQFFVSEESPVQQLLHKAFQHLSEGFCHRVNATIVFRPFDFDKLAELVLLEINSTVSATALQVEVESSVFEHLVAVLWEGQGRNEEFQRWVTQVLGTTISSLIEKLKPSSEHVIKLVADKSHSTAEPVLHLPRTLRIGDEEP